MAIVKLCTGFIFISIPNCGMIMEEMVLVRNFNQIDCGVLQTSVLYMYNEYALEGSTSTDATVAFQLVTVGTACDWSRCLTILALLAVPEKRSDLNARV